MRRAALLLAVLVGCTSHPTGEKNPGAPFRLAFEAAGPVELLNGEGREFPIRLTRSEGFTGRVTLRVEVSPGEAGATARVEEKSRKVVVNVSETARPGDYVVRVVGQAGDDSEVSAELRVRVPPKD
ncbi:MAG: hypothetical protein U0797_01515 [Gemmataceae bacterium]